MKNILRKIYLKIRGFIFYKRHGFYTSQFRDMVYFSKCLEDLKRSNLSFNDYIKDYFNAKQ